MDRLEIVPAHPANASIIDASYEELGKLIDQCKESEIPTETSYEDATHQLIPKEKSTPKGQAMLSRELKMLESHNRHGTGDSLPLVTRLRRRKPVLKNIQTAWQNALETIEKKLTCFRQQRL